MVKLSNTAILAIIFVLVGVLTLVITYIVHKNSMSSELKAGYWIGFVFILLGLCVVTYKVITCGPSDHAQLEMPVENATLETGNIE